jgi:hypothetical protein
MRVFDRRVLVTSLNKIKHGFIVLSGQYPFQVDEFADVTNSAKIMFIDKDLGKVMTPSIKSTEDEIEKLFMAIRAIASIERFFLQCYLFTQGCVSERVKE